MRSHFVPSKKLKRINQCGKESSREFFLISTTPGKERTGSIFSSG